MKRAWKWFSSALTIVSIITICLYVAPIPFFDYNNTTLVLESRQAQIAVAKALSVAVRGPTVELNTFKISRFLFKDGTSVDWLRYSSGALMYEPNSLKSITLGFFSRQFPVNIAKNIADSLEHNGFRVQIVTRPDSSFPEGHVVLVLSNAFQDKSGAGFGVIIRKHALRLGGPTPTRFMGWPS